jgi:ribose transport system substrate-binding protein
MLPVTRPSARGAAPWLVVAALAALAAGCNPPEQNGGSVSPNGPAAAPASGETRRLAFVTNNASDFWTIARAGTEKAKQDLGNVEVSFQLPADGTAAEQKRVVDDLLARGVDGIAISPVDPANQTQMLNETAARTLLFTHDSDAPESNRVCYVGTDNVAAGRQAGELIKKAVPNGGKIMLFVGTLDAMNAKERKQGIEEELRGSNIRIVDTRTDGTDRVRAKANVQDTIVAHADIVCLVGLWSYNGPAILNAVKEAGKTGQIKIVAFDEEDETLAGVKDGSIFATVVQQPYEFGYQSITLMAKYLNGDRSVVPDSKQIFVPTLAVDKSNVEEFSEKLRTLRGR